MDIYRRVRKKGNWGMNWGCEGHRTRPLEVQGEAIQFPLWSENFDPLSIMFSGTATKLPSPNIPLPGNSSSLKTFLRCIPQELGNWRGNGGQKVKSQQGMECKCTGVKEFGVHGEYSQSRYLQRELQKDRELQRTKGDRKLKTVRMEEGWGSNSQPVTKFGL